MPFFQQKNMNLNWMKKRKFWKKTLFYLIMDIIMLLFLVVKLELIYKLYLQTIWYH